MNILLIGSGGREHAILQKLRESPEAETIYVLPGNGGMAGEGTCVDIAAKDIPAIVDFAKTHPVDFAVVAPDDPLVLGAVDALNAIGIPCFGPTQKAAMIEGSKVFAKNLMKQYGIPTARYEVFTDLEAALRYVETCPIPTVVKADGLALGKGVIIAQTMEQAKQAILSIMEDKKFGESGNRVVIEEFLTGPEVSVLAFTDGKTIRPMVSSKDHKRALDGDRGLNTGGMGTISPNPYYTEEMAQICQNTIFEPTIRAMQAEGRPFKGCLYFGLMLTPDGPKVIEYNARFGDPEAQVVLPRLKTDLLDICDAVIDERLADIELVWSKDCSACVVIASGGYPESYQKGYIIDGLDANGQVADAVVYHAGTACKDGVFYTNGGRVLGVTAKAPTLNSALEKAYRAVEKIHFTDCFYRRDIGKTK